MIGRRLLLVFYISTGLVCSGCWREPTVSQWQELEQTEPLACENLLLDEDVISVLDVGVYGSEVFAAIVDRRGGQGFVRYAGPSDEDITRVRLQGERTFLGTGGNANAKDNFYILANDGDVTELEVRNFSHEIMQKIPLDDGMVSAQVFSQPTNALIVLRSEGEKTWLLTVTKDGHSKMDLGKILQDFSAKVVQWEQLAVMVWATNSGFNIWTMGDDPPVALEYTIEEEIESWTIAVRGHEMFLAVVDGNSVVGDLQLKISRYSLPPTPKNVVASMTVRETIRDTHVASPIFAVAGDQLNVLVPSWMDGESTIAKYNIDLNKNQLNLTGYHGIFAQGLTLTEGLAWGGVRVITRSPEVGGSGTYAICEVP